MKKNNTAVISALLLLSVLFTCLFTSCSKYKTLADFINSDELKNEMANKQVEGMDISFEAENDDTVRINYDLHSAVADELLETAKALYNNKLEDKESISSLKQAYDAIHQVFPSKDIKLHVVFRDANGTLIAEKTYTAADFE